MKYKAHKITEQIKELKQELGEHQEKCKHPERHRIFEYKSNEGGYDGPAHDRYWTEYTCELCLKWWTVNDQWKVIGRSIHNK